MKSVNFFNGQSTGAEDYNNAQQFKEESILDRGTDLRSAGIVIDKSSETIVTTGAEKQDIVINPFIAYDADGQRIQVKEQIVNLKRLVDPNDPTATDFYLGPTGSLFPGNTKWTLVVRYKTIPAGPVKHHTISGEPFMTTLDDSYEFIVRAGLAAGQSDDVVLASLTVDANKQITVDTSVAVASTLLAGAIAVQSSIVTQEEAAGTDTAIASTDSYGGIISFEKHINAVGTGPISSKNPHGLSPADIGIDVGELANHQSMCHVDGIRSDNLLTTDTAMYPWFRRETNTDEEFVYIQRLSSAQRELLIANGTILGPTDFPNNFTFAMQPLASDDQIGYHLFVVNVEKREIQHFGPYEHDTDQAFLAVLNNRNLFPICSFRWDNVSYDYNGDNVNDKHSYDIMPGTFKDRRVFNNTSIDNFRPDHAFALSQFAPYCNDTAYLHNARLLSGKNLSRYSVDEKNMLIYINGGPEEGGTAVEIKFSGGGYAELQPETVVDQMNRAFTDKDEDGNVYLKAYARVTDDGYISISAPRSIEIIEAASNDASEILGFSDTYNNKFQSSNIIKELIYEGDRNGIVLFTYDAKENVTRIDYLLGGGVRRYNTFKYNGDVIVAVREVVEPL